MTLFPTIHRVVVVVDSVGNVTNYTRYLPLSTEITHDTYESLYIRLLQMNVETISYCLRCNMMFIIIIMHHDVTLTCLATAV